jgi:uncharacterized protein YndB with AHSA1/START domain
MSIAPIVRTVRTKASPERAFDLFVSRVGDWWLARCSIGAEPFETVVIEPFEGGRWFERDAKGRETEWGKVLAYEAPHRLLLAWQISADWTFDPELLTEVEVTFAPAEGGGAHVTLEHRNLERYGAAAERHAQTLNGWSGLMDAYADFTHAPQETA